MQSFNPNQANQPTIQRESFLFIEFGLSPDESCICREKIDPESVRDNGIGAIVAGHVQTLVKKGYDIYNVYVGSLL